MAAVESIVSGFVDPANKMMNGGRCFQYCAPLMITFGGRRLIKEWPDIKCDDARKSFDGCDLRKLKQERPQKDADRVAC